MNPNININNHINKNQNYVAKYMHKCGMGFHLDYARISKKNRVNAREEIKKELVC